MTPKTELHPDLKQLAQKINVPTLPEVVRKINAMVNDPKVGLNEIGRAVSTDAPITSRVLRIANSSYYGLQDAVVSAEQAATVIGARAMQAVAMQASVMNQYEHLASVDDFDIRAVWKHAVFTAQVCQTLSRHYRGESALGPEEFYTCGLLHDIGKVVLLDSLGEQYVEVYRDATREGRPVHISEKKLLGYMHTDVGALVATRWDFPDQVTDAIRYHHGPRHEIENNVAVALVAASDQITYRVEAGAGADAMDKLAGLCKVVLDINPRELEAVIEFAIEIEPQIEL